MPGKHDFKGCALKAFVLDVELTSLQDFSFRFVSFGGLCCGIFLSFKRHLFLQGDDQSLEIDVDFVYCEFKFCSF